MSDAIYTGGTTFDPIGAERVANRITATGTLMFIVAVGLAFGPHASAAALSAVVFLVGLSFLARLPPA
jgi:hypothetical protein